MYAHSVKHLPREQWEPLGDHLKAVGRRAGGFAQVFGWADAARAAGLLHDIGKASASFQAYIQAPDDDTARRGPDHSTAGARVASSRYAKGLGRMLAYAIAGHHAGLADASELGKRLSPDNPIPAYEGWQPHVGPLPESPELRPSVLPSAGAERGFSAFFLTRMIFSCLVDADFLETEVFYARATNTAVERGGHRSIETLRDRLRAHMAKFGAADGATPVNRWRALILQHAVQKAAMNRGFFTMTVPTGGGKTLASLSFALEHAAHWSMRRVVYVIPFTSIIEQTASVFRRALRTEEDVLEHHASFDWEEPRKTAEADDEAPSGLSKLRKSAENWDAPIVVTTAVQFFESLFAARTSRCRKLHNLADAVIVLDEAQSLPLPVLRPCLAALDELQRNYGASIVLCTATQPAWREDDAALIDQAGRNFGLDIAPERELAPDPQGLYQALKRVEVEVLQEEVADETIAARFAEQPQMLCIVNSRAHARAVYDAIAGLPGAVQLTTLMCPRHRRAVLERVRARLEAGEPVRLVATSLIEAGVDVDFPEVWRAAAGLDSIAQAAGRCNREGRLALGRTVVFTPTKWRPPHALETFWQAARPVLKQHNDVLGLAAIRGYFRELYWQKGEDALDALEVDSRRGILPAIAERAAEHSFSFRAIADAFRLIDEAMEPVIVPWDEDARKILARIAGAALASGADLRRLQQYTVSIPRNARAEWLARGALRAVHPALGEGLLAFGDLAHYRPETGLDLTDIRLRSPEDNCI